MTNDLWLRQLRPIHADMQREPCRGCKGMFVCSPCSKALSLYYLIARMAADEADAKDIALANRYIRASAPMDLSDMHLPRRAFDDSPASTDIRGWRRRRGREPSVLLREMQSADQGPVGVRGSWATTVTGCDDETEDS